MLSKFAKKKVCYKVFQQKFDRKRKNQWQSHTDDLRKNIEKEKTVTTKNNYGQISKNPYFYTLGILWI